MATSLQAKNAAVKSVLSLVSSNAPYQIRMHPFTPTSIPDTEEQVTGGYTPWHYFDQKQNNTSLTENDLDDGNSSSDSDGDYSTMDELDSDHESLPPDAVPGPNLCSDNEFRDWRGHLLAFASDQLCPVIDRYRSGSNKKLPIRSANAHLRSEFQEQDNDDAELVIITCLDAYFHLACPYYQKDPIRFQSCLQRDNLQSTTNIIQHLRRHHRMPIYCPNCRAEFKAALDRDLHARRSTCRYNPHVQIGGLSDGQLVKLNKLAKTHKPHLGEQGRWMLIWATLFPDVEAPASPYLEQGIGRSISILREFWAAYGKELIFQFLNACWSQETKAGIEDRAVEDLSRWTLDQLIQKVLDEENEEHNGRE